MIFTIDNDNDIRVHETETLAEEAAKSAAGTLVVHSEKELTKAAAEWPASRLVELWNSFAGVAPFTDCKPVKKFAARDKAVARIWTTIQRLGTAIAPNLAQDPKLAPETKKARKPKAAKSAKAAPKGKAAKGKNATAGKPREGTHKAQVISMLQCKGGATMDQIMEATGWQKHTVRGFIAGAMKKAGYTVESFKSDKGERTYRIDQ